MPGLPQYLLESSFCLLIFYGFYYVLLRKETFFQINRVYLIVTPLLAILVPLLHIDLQAPPEAQATGGTIEEFIIPVISNAAQFNSELAAQIEQPTPLLSLSFGDAVILIYFFGAFGMGLRLLIGLLRLFRLIRASKQSEEEDYTLVNMEGNFPAASFFSYIFWNGDKNDEKQRWILEHELVHLRQWHSLDVLAMELIVIVKWFNPLIYFFRESLKATHEYIADNYVVSTLGSAPSYAKVLVNHSCSAHSNRLVNTFSALIKKRLMMLGQDQSRAWRKIKYLLSLPLLGMLMLLFSFNLVEQLPQKITTPLSQVNTYLEDLGAQDLLVVDRLFEDQQAWVTWGDKEIALAPMEERDASLNMIAIKRSSFEKLQKSYFQLHTNRGVVDVKNIEFRIVPQAADYFIKVMANEEHLGELYQVIQKVDTDFNLMLKLQLPDGTDLFGVIMVSEDGRLNINSPTIPFSFPTQEKLGLAAMSGKEDAYHFTWGKIDLPLENLKLNTPKEIKFVANSNKTNYQKRFGRMTIDRASLQTALQQICNVRDGEGNILKMDSLSFQFQRKDQVIHHSYAWGALQEIWQTPQQLNDWLAELSAGDQILIRQWNATKRLLFGVVLDIAGPTAVSTDKLAFNIGTLAVPLVAQVQTEAPIQKNIFFEQVKALLRGEFSFYKNDIRLNIKHIILELKKTSSADAERKLIRLDETQRLSDEKIANLWQTLQAGDHLTLRELHLENDEKYALGFRIVTNEVTSMEFAQPSKDYIQWGGIQAPVHIVNALQASSKFTVESVDASVFEAAKGQALSVYHAGVREPIERVYIAVQNEEEEPLFCDGALACIEETLAKVKAESSIHLLIRTETAKVFYAVFSVSSTQKNVYRYNPSVSDFINRGIKALSFRTISSIEPAIATFQDEPHLFEWGNVRVPFGVEKGGRYQGEITMNYDEMLMSITKDIKVWFNEELAQKGTISIIRYPRLDGFSMKEVNRDLLTEMLTIDLERQEESKADRINLLLDRLVKGDRIWLSADLEGTTVRLMINIFDPDAPWKPSVNREALLLERSIYQFQFIHQDGHRTRIKMDTTDARYRWMYDRYKDGKQLDIIHIPNFKTVKRIINETDEVIPRSEIDQTYLLDESLANQPVELFPEFYDFEDKAVMLKWRGLTGKLNHKRDALADFLASQEKDLVLMVGEEELEIVHFNMTIVPKDGSNIKIQANDIHHSTIEKQIAALAPRTSIYFDRILVKQADGTRVHFPLALVFNLE